MITPLSSTASPPPGNKDAQLMQLATKLEASFLAEMLKNAGFGRTSESFGGGIGEEQFASFVTENHARKLAETGGVGLAEHLFNSLKGQQNGK